ncbi:MAG: O-antigen ligase family protein [Ardenticatenales bacterium]|nr:O-antigen ligase family protein [Ardenticatenales bacterium]
MSPVLQRLADWELGWLLLLAPLFFFPRVSLSPLLIALPLLWGLRWLATGHIIPRTPLDGSILLLLLAVLVSQWATPYPTFSLAKVAGLLLSIALYYTLVERTRSQQGVWQSVLLFVLATCGLAAISLVGTNWTGKFLWLSAITGRLPRLLQGMPGTLPEGLNPNSIAGALLLTTPLLLMLLWHFRDKPLPVSSQWQPVARAFLWLSFLLIAMTLILTQSRGGYIGLGVGLLALLPRRRLTMLLGGGTLVLLVLVILTEGQLLQGYFDSTIEDPEVVEEQAQALDSLQGRQEVWQRAISTIEDFPLTGVGMGTFRRVGPALYPWVTLPADIDIGHVHNHLLAAAVDLGLPGLVAYLALWLGSAAMAWDIWRVAPASTERTLCLGIVAGLIAHFVWGMADANVLGSKGGFLLWLSLASLASLHRATIADFQTRTGEAVGE